jgi:hypothetical protein
MRFHLSWKSNLICFVVSVCTVCVARADYIATGPFTAVETGFLGGQTKYTLSWLQNSKGERWQMPIQHKDVSEVNPTKGGDICFIQVKSRLGGVIGWAIDAASTPTFFGQKTTTSTPQKIDPEYIFFPCRQI